MLEALKCFNENLFGVPMNKQTDHSGHFAAGEENGDGRKIHLKALKLREL